MLNLGLYFLRVVGPIRSTQVFFSQFSKITIDFISSLWLMPGLYNYWWCVTSFESIPGNKYTYMFYVASIITFSVSLELLSTLLVCYKLNIFRPSRVEPVGFTCTVILRMCHVCNVRWNGLIWLVETCFLVVHQYHN